MTLLAELRATAGVDEYLADVEEGLQTALAAYPGVAAEAGAEALEGGKRLRPLLVFLASPEGAAPPVEAAVAVELVHMATLVHDDLVDGARLRHGRPSVWSVYGPRVAIATGDYLFARAFATLAATGARDAVGTLAEAAVSLARGEALQRRQAHDPDTSIESYLERCALKTGKLFEAACRLAGGSGEFGLALGIAFQIADDILDCTGDAADTGKMPGTDLREGTPTLPLLLAAREDEVVRRALAGGPLEGVLVRVASTGALERSREVALEYARRARAQVDGGLRREELLALTDAVVNRER
ncbi:MAG: polyprenyl synthetase family protein [Thermoleophilia bacterium]|nr:polyprenyl synthetase family protein [Thermoleophilia bacterium]